MKRALKFLFISGFVLFIGMNSVYFKKLSKMAQQDAAFNAEAFAKDLWNKMNPGKTNSAVCLTALMDTFSADQETAVEQYTNAIAIGNYKYAMVRARALVLEVNEDDVIVEITRDGTPLRAIVATEYIYGNAIRDASGAVDLKMFPDTDKLNAVSAALNRISRTKVAAPFRATVKKGDEIEIAAAIELNIRQVDWTGLELLPLHIQII